MRSKISISSRGHGENTHVFVDGKELDCTHISFYCGVQGEMIASVTARVYVDEVEVDGVVNRVNMKDVIRASDEECLERAMLLIESGTLNDIRESLGRALAQTLRAVRG